MIQIAIRNIALPFTADASEVIAEAKKRLRPILRAGDIESISIYKRSLDARKRDSIRYVYTALAECRVKVDSDKLKKLDCVELRSSDITPEFGYSLIKGKCVKLKLLSERTEANDYE